MTNSSEEANMPPMPFPLSRSFGALASCLLLLTAAPLSAQSFHTGLALVTGGDPELAMSVVNHEEQFEPPEGLEEMTVAEALSEHLTGWVGMDLVQEEVGVRIHAIHLNGGEVVQRFEPGRLISPEEYGDGREYMESLFCFPFGGFGGFAPEEVMSGELGKRQVRGYDAATACCQGEVLDQPGEFVISGVFPSPREQRRGDVLLLVMAPDDPELRTRGEATVMLVMF